MIFIRTDFGYEVRFGLVGYLWKLPDILIIVGLVVMATAPPMVETLYHLLFLLLLFSMFPTFNYPMFSVQTVASIMIKLFLTIINFSISMNIDISVNVSVDVRINIDVSVSVGVWLFGALVLS